jgi:hypothetical protein
LIVIVVRLECIFDEPSNNESESVPYDDEDASFTLDDAPEKCWGESILVLTCPD